MVVNKNSIIKNRTCYVYLIVVVLFLCLYPVLLRNLPYSMYYVKENDLILKSTVHSINSHRINMSQEYLNSLDKKETALHYASKLKNASLQLLTIITTMKRNAKLYTNEKLGYLTQVVAKIDRELKKSVFINSSILICDVDSEYDHSSEVDYLNSIFPMISHRSSPGLASNRREKEKNDYVWCLQEAMFSVNKSTSYVLVLEDDAIPVDDMFNILNYLVKERLENPISQGEPSNDASFAFLKLYYPEKWDGYGLECSKIIELLSVACVFGPYLYFILRLSFLNIIDLPEFKFYVFCILFVLANCLAIGRVNILEICRLSKFFYKIIPAHGCCTPAVLYQYEQIPAIIKYLNKSKCEEKYGLDLALDDFAINFSLPRYLVQPNLFYHIGLYSSLTKPKMPEYFLKPKNV